MNDLEVRAEAVERGLRFLMLSGGRANLREFLGELGSKEVPAVEDGLTSTILTFLPVELVREILGVTERAGLFVVLGPRVVLGVRGFDALARSLV